MQNFRKKKILIMRYWLLFFFFDKVLAEFIVYESADLVVLAHRLNAILPDSGQSASQRSIITSLTVLSSIVEVFEKELKEEEDLNKKFADLTIKLQSMEDKKLAIEQFLVLNGVKEQFKNIKKLKNKLADKRLEVDRVKNDLDNLKIMMDDENNRLDQELIDCKKQEAEYDLKMKTIKDLIEKSKKICEEITLAMKNFENLLANKSIMIVKTMELEDAKSNYFNRVKEYDQYANEIDNLKLSIENLNVENRKLNEKLSNLKEQGSKLTEAKKTFDTAISICEELEEIKMLFEKIKFLTNSTIEIEQSVDKSNETENDKVTSSLQKQMEISLKELGLFEKEIKGLPQYIENLKFKEKDKIKVLESVRQSVSQLKNEVEGIKFYNKIAHHSLIGTGTTTLICFFFILLFFYSSFFGLR